MAQSRAFATSVPGVRALCGMLNITHNSDDGKAFIQALTSFRCNYVTGDDVSGTEFNLWTSPSHRAELKKMAIAFLDTMGNGTRFWPTARPALGYPPKLQYSNDKAKYAKLYSLWFVSNRLPLYKD